MAGGSEKKGREKAVPTGRMGRFMRLAGLGARTGASLVFKRDSAAIAGHAAEVLGTMRGLAAKAGQMASYVDGFVPAPHKATFEQALRGLRAAAPTSKPEEVRRVVEEDLGAPIERLFATFEDAPFASASIGQVHRATLEGGRAVAVKVQHPGIDRAMESDLENAGLLEGILGKVGPKKLDTKRVFDEVKARFREELDYALEAKRQEFFRTLHAGDPAIHIPAVIAARSGRRVLTSELAHGASLDEAAAATEAERAHYARTMWRFVFKGNLVGGMFNADPHPGNYLFAADRVTFLDFGCCQPIEGERLARARGLHLAALDHDEKGFSDHARAILETRGGAYEAAALAYSRKCFEPIFASPFRITPEFVAGLVADIGNMKKEMMASMKNEDSFVPLPSGMLFMNRLQFGFYSVLAKLDVEADYAEVERGFLLEGGVSRGGGTTASAGPPAG